jgi:hypothetical protein
VLGGRSKENYQPNLIARNLKTNRTNTLGIIIPDITIPFFPQLIRGAVGPAREAGQFLLVLDSQDGLKMKGAVDLGTPARRYKRGKRKLRISGKNLMRFLDSKTRDQESVIPKLRSTGTEVFCA